jgi:DNA-binding CsgD family transcriptional regulator
MAPKMAKAPPLSPRETQICALVAVGQSNKKIGEVLKISPGTVKKHLGQIFLKTACHGRTELAVYYVHSAAKPTRRAKHPTKPRKENHNQ